MKAPPASRRLALIVFGLLGAALFVGGSNLASAQVTFTTPAVARGAIREATQGLNAAIKSNSANQLGQAMVQAQEVIQNLETLGEAGTYARDLAPLMTAYLTALGQFLDLNIRSCENGRLQDGLAMAGLMRSLPSSTRGKLKAYATLEKRLQACTRLTLRIDSMITNTDLKYVSHVDVKVDLVYSVQKDVYSGTGTIRKTAQKFEDPFGNCTVKLSFTPAEFKVQELKLALDESGTPQDAVLQAYTAGQTNEVAHITCPKVGTNTVPFMNWGMAYGLVHQANQNEVVEGWKAGTAPALLTLRLNQQASGGKMTLTESTHYFLVKPQ